MNANGSATASPEEKVDPTACDDGGHADPPPRGGGFLNTLVTAFTVIPALAEAKARDASRAAARRIMLGTLALLFLAITVFCIDAALVLWIGAAIGLPWALVLVATLNLIPAIILVGASTAE